MIPVLETDFVQLLFNQEKSTLRLIWKMNCSSESYRYTYKKVLDLVKKSDVQFLVADIRKLKLVAPSDRKWLQQRIMPKLFRYGIKKVAAVVSGDIFMQKHLSHINKSAAEGQTVKQFGNLPEALKWFDSE